MTNLPDDYDWSKLTDTLAQFPDVVDRIVKKYAQPELSAPFFDARAIGLPPGEVVQLFGYDASRIRFYLRGSAEGLIQMGDRDTLAADLGWIVGTSSATEFHTVAELYVKASAPATVYLWAEYRKN